MKGVTTFLRGDMKIDLRDELQALRMRAASTRRRKDLIWRKLTDVVSTSGSAIHAKEFMALYDDVLAFEKLPVRLTQRTAVIRQALTMAKVPRMRDMKATVLARNYAIVKTLGGPEEASRAMLRLKGKDVKMRWLEQFHGVGTKYSRDIWMDICDPDFEESIALDARVKSFAEKLGFDQKSRALESHLLDFAHSCNLTGWELDRLIFNFGSLILKVI